MQRELRIELSRTPARACAKRGGAPAEPASVLARRASPEQRGNDFRVDSPGILLFPGSTGIPAPARLTLSNNPTHMSEPEPAGDTFRVSLSIPPAHKVSITLLCHFFSLYTARMAAFPRVWGREIAKSARVQLSRI